MNSALPKAYWLTNELIQERERESSLIHHQICHLFCPLLNIHYWCIKIPKLLVSKSHSSQALRFMVVNWDQRYESTAQSLWRWDVFPLLHKGQSNKIHCKNNSAAHKSGIQNILPCTNCVYWPVSLSFSMGGKQKSYLFNPQDSKGTVDSKCFSYTFLSSVSNCVYAMFALFSPR